MAERDPNTGQFAAPATAEAEAPARAPLVHPGLRPRKQRAKPSMKQRRTIVRTIKLVNGTNPAMPRLVQAPIEPSHNNRGSLNDPTQPIRHYLDKGFVQPHEWDGEPIMVRGEAVDLQRVFCSVLNCWETATVTFDPEYGTERCEEHNEQFRIGLIRYATAAREYAE